MRLSMTTKVQEILQALEIEKLDVLTLLALQNAIHIEINKKEAHLFEVSARDWKSQCRKVYEEVGPISAVGELRRVSYAGLSHAKYAIEKWAAEEGWPKAPKEIPF
jgi:hypothetical protein